MPDSWLGNPVQTVDSAAREAALERQNSLTKPPGSLGSLEQIAVNLAGMQGRDRPRIDHCYITVFAADHGVAAEGVSAFPQVVTAEMVRNFARGGAAISVLARDTASTLEVVNLGTVVEIEPLQGVVDAVLGFGTANLAVEPAMTSEQLEGALDQGRQAIGRALGQAADLFVGGEMGIANTTAASTLACLYLQQPAELLAGPGTGLDAGGVTHKTGVIEKALAMHGSYSHDPYEILRRAGGFEIAALAGAYICAAQHGLPVIVDGFISSAAALAAERIVPGVRNWMLLGHQSAEPGHQMILKELDLSPMLDLGMRLGEGSGAATAITLVRVALALHNNMATFAEAGVSGG